MAALKRRDFVKQTLGAGLFAGTMLQCRSVKAANEEIRLAIIGLGGRGGEHAKMFEKVEGVKLVAFVDPDEKRQASFTSRYPGSKSYADVRKMLEDDNVDAVSIASCNHWHCLAAIWAMQAGKDVYVEKPLSHSQWEGRQVVRAARKYNKIVQHGTQQRTSPFQADIKRFLHDEKALGEIQYVQVCRYGIRSSIGKRATPLSIPSEVDYNLWLGPAEDQPLFRDKLHYDWHWDWNTGSGEMGNWGVHVLDDVKNVVFQDQVRTPARVLAGGGRVAWNDAGQTPNVHFAYFDTGKIPTYIGLSNLAEKPGSKKGLNERGVTSGYLVQCEGGYYTGRRGGGQAYDADGKKMRSFSGDSGSQHGQNFIDAVRTREASLLNAEIGIGHDSTGWCNLANIGFRAGGTFSLEEARERHTGDEAWNNLLEKMTQHLQAHDVSLSAAELRLSPVLTHDPETEQFTGDFAEVANSFLKRKYRAPFIVPEQV